VLDVPDRDSDTGTDAGSGVALRDITEPRFVPPVRPKSEAAVKTARVETVETVDHVDDESFLHAHAAAPQALSEEAAEQIYAVLGVAFQDAIAPLIAKQKELETRLAWLQERERQAAPVAVAASVPAPRATPSVVPTTYGFVTQPTGPQRPSAMDIALSQVGPVDVPDFGRGRRTAGMLLVGLLLAGVVAAIAATILSHV
jgi:hypothetical protein